MAQITQETVTPNGAALIKDGNGFPAGYRYANITTTATTEVKATGGFLHSITINNSTATGTITIYDNTAGSGTTIGTITVGASPVLPVTLTYDVWFNTGLTIVTGVETSDITVSYV